MPPALAQALPDTDAARQRALRAGWPWSSSALPKTRRQPLQRWGARFILEGAAGAQEQKPGAQSGGLRFARGLCKSRSTRLGRAGPRKCGAHNYHPGRIRLIVE